MIYFLQPVDGGPIKIGFTDNLDVRHKQLEAHYGQPLTVLATMPGGRDEEREIHSRFGHLRFGRTEQFQPAMDLMQFINRPLFVNQGDVELMEIRGQPKTIGVRSTPEWAAWLERLADHDRNTLAGLIDRALLEYAQNHGFKEEAPKR